MVRKNCLILLAFSIVLALPKTLSAQSTADLLRRIITLEEQVRALTTRVADQEYKTQDMVREMSDDGKVPYIQLNARLSLFGNYLAKKPIGEGATLTVGTNVDAIGEYIEIENASDGYGPASTDGQSHIGLFVASIAKPRPGKTQPNIGILSYATNSPSGNTPFIGSYQYAESSPYPYEGFRMVEVDGNHATQKSISFSSEGIILADGAQKVDNWLIQKGGYPSRHLWP